MSPCGRTDNRTNKWKCYSVCGYCETEFHNIYILQWCKKAHNMTSWSLHESWSLWEIHGHVLFARLICVDIGSDVKRWQDDVSLTLSINGVVNSDMLWGNYCCPYPPVLDTRQYNSRLDTPPCQCSQGHLRTPRSHLRRRCWRWSWAQVWRPLVLGLPFPRCCLSKKEVGNGDKSNPYICNVWNPYLSKSKFCPQTNWVVRFFSSIQV